jgi:endonuclease G
MEKCLQKMVELRRKQERRKSSKTLWCLVAIIFTVLISQGFSQVPQERYTVSYVPSIDTIFDRGIYKSYFNYQLQEPLYVSYILSKGGGNCSRSKFRFKNDTKVPMIDDEYTNSGFDRGHLANAEDFAYDCVKDELTFRYYNCLPQTPNMNRGVWKSWETKIRQQSQTDSLLIFCGGIWETGTYVKGIAVPDRCWKVVYSLKTSKILHVLIFTNLVTGSTVQETSIEILEKNLGRKLVMRF